MMQAYPLEQLTALLEYLDLFLQALSNKKSEGGVSITFISTDVIMISNSMSSTNKPVHSCAFNITEQLNIL